MLGFRLMNDVSNRNSFDVVDEFELYDKNTSEIYFMLFQDSGYRYIPDVGAVIEVTFDHIDTSKKVIARLATQPFSDDDRSICKVPIMSTDKIATGSMRVYITEGGVKKELKALSDLLVTASDMNRFVC